MQGLLCNRAPWLIAVRLCDTPGGQGVSGCSSWRDVQHSSVSCHTDFLQYSRRLTLKCCETWAGAAGGIGQPLALLLKTYPQVGELRCAVLAAPTATLRGPDTL